MEIGLTDIESIKKAALNIYKMAKETKQNKEKNSKKQAKYLKNPCLKITNK